MVYKENDENTMDGKEDKCRGDETGKHWAMSLLKTIRQRQLRFMGHICRKGEIEHLAITGKIEGKRSRGRPREAFVIS